MKNDEYISIGTREECLRAYKRFVEEEKPIHAVIVATKYLLSFRKNGENVKDFLPDIKKIYKKAISSKEDLEEIMKHDPEMYELFLLSLNAIANAIGLRRGKIDKLWKKYHKSKIDALCQEAKNLLNEDPLEALERLNKANRIAENGNAKLPKEAKKIEKEIEKRLDGLFSVGKR